MERIGTFICTGCGIGEALDVEALAGVARELQCATCTTHPALCSPEGVALVREAVAAGTIDGALLVACSPRAKMAEFTFDADKVAVERVAVREQVVWSHPPKDEDTQMLAEDLLRMGHTRLAKTQFPKPFAETIERTVLVVGGGLAGMEAARAAAALGHPVVVVEATSALGGALAASRDALPEAPPFDSLHPNRIRDLVEEVSHHPAIRVVTNARLTRIAGQPGQFSVDVQTDTGAESFTVGAIVQATGARPYDAGKLAHLGYGQHPDVITSQQLEAMLASGTLRRPSDGQLPSRIAFVQCAGSRDPEHLPYCSAECCGTTLRQVAAIHRDFPSVETAVVYRDMRTPGQLERFYAAVQNHPKSFFTRGEVAAVGGNGRLSLTLKDSLLGNNVALEADLVVLAVGMVPNAADGEAIRALHDAQRRAQTGESETQREEARKLAEKLAAHEGTEILNLVYRQGPDLPALKYGFPDSHFICFPYETRRTGIYAAGAVHAPMDAAQAAEDGWGAAMKAVQCIEAISRGEAVHPRSGDRGIPDFFLQRCTQCKRCTEECPFGTLNEDEKGTPQLNPLRCRRCGICMGACPERIISFPDYSVDAVASMIKAMSVPEEFEEKPRILALMCENDALPALDAAALARKPWNPWVRVIPIRCLGSTNIVWIAEALSRGIDGVILIGCKYGDDYQCHYVRGSELAHTRLSNVQETLTRLALEPERIRVVELAHDEFDRIPQLFDEFASTLEELGPNPLKGF
ncbi:MAG: hydrogenase iron-sulfur subunit [Thermoanaerobaculaceae bacterium]|nr:hydrogenase iron-sulfur subunit [Thermoanaerobaculaceae bacterium]